MSHDSVVRARIDERTKRQAEKVFAACGLTLSDGIRMMLVQTAKNKEIPFSIHVPNKRTLAAMKELEENRGKLKQYDTIEELFKALNA